MTLAPASDDTNRPRRRVVALLAVWALASTVAAGVLIAVQPLTGLSPAILPLVMLAPTVGGLVCWLTLRAQWPRATPPA